VEYIDFQYSNLTDKHTTFIARIIKEQFELKEMMRWRLGLRNEAKVNVGSMGFKCLNISNNCLGD